MSFQAMTWAVKQKVGNATGKAILLMLANYADQDGVCFPSQEKLAQECECSRRTVGTFLAEFEKRGLVRRCERRRKDGYRTSDEVRLSLDGVYQSVSTKDDSISCAEFSRENPSCENDDNLMCKDCTAITSQVNHQYIISQEPIGSFEINAHARQKSENLDFFEVEDLGNPESSKTNQPPVKAKPPSKAVGKVEIKAESDSSKAKNQKNDFKGRRAASNLQNDNKYRNNIETRLRPLKMANKTYLETNKDDEFQLTAISEGNPPLRAKSKTGTKANLKAEIEREFEEVFWPQVVRKEGKAKAKTAFVKARQKASLQEIVSGLARYQDNLMSKGTDIKFYAHPSTFLNGERWTDEPAPIITDSRKNNHEQHYQHNRNASKSYGTQIAELWVEFGGDRQSGKEAGEHISDDFLSQTRIDGSREELSRHSDFPIIEPAFITSRAAAYQPFA